VLLIDPVRAFAAGASEYDAIHGRAASDQVSRPWPDSHQAILRNAQRASTVGWMTVATAHDDDPRTADSEATECVDTVSLRERKKDATRRTLAERALELARNRGYAGFTIADLVAEVGVSRRTFSNYFASKAECIAAVADGWLDDVLDAIRSAPAGASLIDVLQTGLLAVARDGAERWGALQQVADSAPDLQAQMLAGDEVVAELVSGEVARRTTLPTDDIRVRLLAIFAVTAGREALTRWAAARADAGTAGNAELAELLKTGFSILDLDGLPRPPRI
jgi:AcrR family transcriptional regulator